MNFVKSSDRLLCRVFCKDQLSETAFSILVRDDDGYLVGNR